MSQNSWNVSDILDASGLDYWQHHGPHSKIAISFNAFFVSLIMIASVALNGGTLFIYYRYRKINLSLRAYFISISIANLVSPLTTYWMNVMSSVYERWLFAQIGCTIYGVVQGYCAFVSITVVLVVSVERLISLRRGFTSQTMFYRLLFVWTYPLPAVLPPLFGWSRYTLTGFMNTCCFDFVHTDMGTRTYIIFISVYGFFIPVVVICTCYGLIMRRVYTQAHELRNRLVSTRSSCLLNLDNNNYDVVRQQLIDHTRWQQQLDSIWVMGVVAAVFILAWTPYAVAAYVAQFGPRYIISPLTTTVLSVIAKSNTSVNPIIYMFSNASFRRGVQKTWRDWMTNSQRRWSVFTITRSTTTRSIFRIRRRS